MALYDKVNEKLLEDQENIVSEDPQIGVTWDYPQCLDCKFNDNAFCNRYNAKRLETGTNIFDCPGFVSIKDEKASQLFGFK